MDVNRKKTINNLRAKTVSPQWGYHDLIIYGYDDSAVVHSLNGKHYSTGVFFVRNSWGGLPDNGVEYMTYKYFKTMAEEATSIFVIRNR